jgi:hypothetical protein
LDAPAALLLGDALRANTTLTSLTLNHARLWSDRAAVGPLLCALTGHTSLRKLRVAGELHLWEEDMLHAGTLLGALVAADAPALTALDVSNSCLSDDGLRPLFEALSGNSHLRELNCADTESPTRLRLTCCCRRCAPTRACARSSRTKSSRSLAPCVRRRRW